MLLFLPNFKYMSTVKVWSTAVDRVVPNVFPDFPTGGFFRVFKKCALRKMRKRYYYKSTYVHF